MSTKKGIPFGIAMFILVAFAAIIAGSMWATGMFDQPTATVRPARPAYTRKPLGERNPEAVAIEHSINEARRIHDTNVDVEPVLLDEAQEPVALDEPEPTKPEIEQPGEPSPKRKIKIYRVKAPVDPGPMGLIKLVKTGMDRGHINGQLTDPALIQQWSGTGSDQSEARAFFRLVSFEGRPTRPEVLAKIAEMGAMPATAIEFYAFMGRFKSSTRRLWVNCMCAPITDARGVDNIPYVLYQTNPDWYGKPMWNYSLRPAMPISEKDGSPGFNEWKAEMADQSEPHLDYFLVKIIERY